MGVSRKPLLLVVSCLCVAHWSLAHAQLPSAFPGDAHQTVVSVNKGATVERNVGNSNSTLAPSPDGLSRDVIDLGPYVEYLEDSEGQLLYEDAVRSDAFRPLPDGSASFGYTSSAFWLRFPTHLLRELQDDALLEVAYFSLDYVTVYAPGAPPQVSGNARPFATRPVNHRHFVFPLSLPAQPETAYVLVHVRSTGSVTIPLRLWSQRAFIDDTQRNYAVLTLYYGAVLALLLYNLLLWLSLRDRNYLIYVLFVASMAVTQLASNGLGNQFVWTDWFKWNGVAPDVGASIAGVLGSWFVCSFLDTRHTMPTIDKALRITMAGFALNAVFMLGRAALSTDGGQAVQAGAVALSIGGLVVCLLGMAAGGVALTRGHSAARFYLGAWGVLLVGVSVAALRNFGWIPHNGFTSNSIQIGSAFEMLFLSFALADRIHMERNARESAQSEALAAKQELVEALTDSERVLEARVAERTEELKEKQRELARKQSEIWEMQKQKMLLEERERIMRDMHDGVGGYLVATLAQVESGDTCASGRACRSDIADSLRNALDDLRLMIDSLDPVDEDLLAVLGMFRSRLGIRLTQAGLRLHWEVSDIPPIPNMGPQTVLQVMRVLQESVANVLKHAKATTIRISTGTVVLDGELGVYVDVADDGVGMAGMERRGRGLGNMQHRAKSIGARLEIDSQAIGTRVRLWIPLVARLSAGNETGVSVTG